MNLEEAKIKLQELVEIGTNLHSDDIWQEAVSTVLSALDERYNKGYQDGFKQAKFDCEMDKLQKEMTVSELAKIIKNDIELPFMSDLSNKIMSYQLIDRPIYEMDEMVDEIWQ